MRRYVRRLAAPAVLAALGCLSAPVIGAMGTPAATAAVAVRRAARPAAGPDLATIGGPLMASQGIVVNYPSAKVPRLPAVPASAWVIANAGTGQVLAAKDPHGRYGPASTLKVLTAITLIPRLNPDAMVTASRLAATTEPNDAGLIAGRQYRVSDLFTALLTISANDAAVALTQAVGSFAEGMALINAEARHLQAYDVVAMQPNGLPANGQVESAYDEALIARQALSMPSFMKYDSTLSSRFEVKPGHWETLVNQDWLLTRYPGGIGGKIGWTVSSEATYVGMASRHGVTLIVTIMHCTPLKEITSAIKLLNWGFAMNGKVTPVGTLVPPLATATAQHGRQARAAHRGRHVTVTAAHAGGSHAGAARRPGSDSGSAAVAVAAGLAAAAGLALAGLTRSRRKLATRHQQH